MCCVREFSEKKGISEIKSMNTILQKPASNKVEMPINQSFDAIASARFQSKILVNQEFSQ